MQVCFFTSFLGGSFPTRTLTTSKAPPTQAYNCFMVTQACALPMAIHYRTYSCFCDACMGGELTGCANSASGHIPQWQYKIVEQTPYEPLISRETNSTKVLRLIEKLLSFSDVLKFYFCLGWVENRQQPAILCLSHLKANESYVRCHLLPPYMAEINSFAWTVVAKPNQLCPHRTLNSWNSTPAQSINFPLDP